MLVGKKYDLQLIQLLSTVPSPQVGSAPSNKAHDPTLKHETL